MSNTTPNQEIKNLTQKTIFDIYQKNYPKIVEFVRAGISRGETPKSIQRFLKKKLSKNSIITAHVVLIAEYLLSNKN